MADIRVLLHKLVGVEWVPVSENDFGVSNWADITDTPTTLSGYGITDAASLSGDNVFSGNQTFGFIYSTEVEVDGGVYCNELYCNGASQFSDYLQVSGPVSGDSFSINSSVGFYSGGSATLVIKNGSNACDWIKFGGETSSFPALKIVGNEIFIKKADDSANTNLNCAGLYCSALSINGVFSGPYATAITLLSSDISDATVGTESSIGNTLVKRTSSGSVSANQLAALGTTSSRGFFTLKYRKNSSYSVGIGAVDYTASRIINVPDADGTFGIVANSDGKIRSSDVFDAVSQASSSADDETLVKRGSGGGATFFISSDYGLISSTSLAINAIEGLTGGGIGVRGFDSVDGYGVLGESGAGVGGHFLTTYGDYHATFGSDSGVSSTRGWFVWKYGGFKGTLKTNNLTEDFEWILPNKNGDIVVSIDGVAIINAKGGNSGSIGLESDDGGIVTITNPITGTNTENYLINVPLGEGTLALVGGTDGYITSNDISDASNSGGSEKVVKYGVDGEIVAGEFGLTPKTTIHADNTKLLDHSTPLAGTIRIAADHVSGTFNKYVLPKIDSYPSGTATVGMLRSFADSTAANAVVSVGDAWWDSTLLKVRVRLS